MPLDLHPGTASRQRIPLTCVWEITNACNLRCIHCESACGDAAPAELSTNEALALARDLGLAGCKTVNLTGGEPLLRHDWSRLSNAISKLGMSVHLVTNGLLLDAGRLEEAASSGVVPRPIKGSWTTSPGSLKRSMK